MADYIIGDIHGCAYEFQALLDKLNYNKSKDNLYLTGDLVGKGKYPLLTLEIAELNNAQWVLGNHDIYCLMTLYQLCSFNNEDNFQHIMQSNKCNYWIDYIKQRPLSIVKDNFVLTHAGIHPYWDLNFLLKVNKFTHRLLSGIDRLTLKKLQSINGIKYHKRKNDLNKLKYFLNVLTRMRYFKLDKKDIVLNFSQHLPPENVSSIFMPWYKLFDKLQLISDNHKVVNYQNKDIYFGHWAMLADIKLTNNQTNNIFCLDTSCVYGNKLSAINVHTKEIVDVEYIKS